MHPLILGPLVVAVFTGFLAFLIAMTDRYVNDYGTCTIDINGGKKVFDVKGGSPILGTLADQSIFIPSACGGRGSCGACKVKVLSDVGPHLPTETPYLTAAEIAENVRLACQIKIKKSLALELPEYLFNIRKYKTTVESIRDLTYDTKEVLMRISDADMAASGGIKYESGQYAQLVVPPYGGIKEEVQRAYSMSSVPGDPAHIELIVRLVPGGIATTWVHTVLKRGDSVDCIGPFGDFVVRDTPATMVCIAGGSGMAPFKSMLNHMAATGAHPDKDIWYFYGGRNEKDFYYLPELRELEKKLAGRFHFVPTLSDPAFQGDWDGERGRLIHVLERYLKEKIPADKGLEGYLCGSPGMIDACSEILIKAGVPEDKLYFDKFS